MLKASTPSRLERWQAGCLRVLELSRARQAQGCAGKDSRVAAAVSRLRPPPGRIPRRRRAGSPATIVAVATPLPPRRAPWLGRRREATRTDDAKQQLAGLRAHAGDLAEAMPWTQDFARLGRQRPPDPRAPGLARATARGLQAFKSCANGLRAAEEAVNAGRTLPGSTGPVAGQSNRLQRYGRAPLALLRQRVVLPTEARGVGGEQPAPAPNLSDDTLSLRGGRSRCLSRS
jgi:transposase